MSEAAPVEIDYTKMTDGELVNELGDDASKWAAAFCQYADKKGIKGIEEGWMLAWFASAIEHSTDVRHNRGRPAVMPVLPDGSSFFVATV